MDLIRVESVHYRQVMINMLFDIKFKEKLFHITNSEMFVELAVELFRYQSKANPVYKKYIQQLGVKPRQVADIKQIPFLPIEFFKTHKVVSGNMPVTKTFISSGTTSVQKSRHYISDESLYKRLSVEGFEFFFGPLSEFCILALVPTVSDQPSSSLAYMINNFVKVGINFQSNFFFQNYSGLLEQLKLMSNSTKKNILFGVSYALIDFVQHNRKELKRLNLTEKNLIVMETGGMKGHKKEMIRTQLHKILCDTLGVTKISSEYGMTELLSQAYSKKDGIFNCPPWMKVLIRDINDPLSITTLNSSGGINVIDLGNIHSCAFIATQDLGKLYDNGSFEVLGRFDNSDIRGCNLLIA